MKITLQDFKNIKIISIVKTYLNSSCLKRLLVQKGERILIQVLGSIKLAPFQKTNFECMVCNKTISIHISVFLNVSIDIKCSFNSRDFKSYLMKCLNKAFYLNDFISNSTMQALKCGLDLCRGTKNQVHNIFLTCQAKSCNNMNNLYHFTVVNAYVYNFVL